jgi:hypothetical protein
VVLRVALAGHPLLVTHAEGLAIDPVEFFANNPRDALALRAQPSLLLCFSARASAASRPRRDREREREREREKERKREKEKERESSRRAAEKQRGRVGYGD